MRQGLWLVGALVIAGGCAPPAKRPVAAPASPLPSPVARLGAVADSPELTFTDKNGKRVASIAAQSGAVVGSTGMDTLGNLQKARAMLYQNGKPAAILTANTIRADQKTRIITATGNVVLSTVNPENNSANRARADQMVWNHDRHRVTGTGNVVLSSGDAVRLPGTTLVADTRLQSAEITGGDAPITGTIP